MGTRIHKAVGWGMRDDVFRANVAFVPTKEDISVGGGDGFGEALHNKLEAITELIMPEQSVRKIWEGWGGLIFQPNLLAKTFQPGEECTDFVRCARRLYEPVADGDGPTLVHLFLPSGLRAAHMYRFDDTIDYVENTHDMTTGKFAENPLPSVAIELQQNPYPWNNDFMDADGKPDSSGSVWDFEREELGLVPRPPAELRWWLTETGILKPDAWKLLRPYYAKWWG